MYTKLKIDKLVRNTLALSSTQQSKTSQPLSNGHHFYGPNWTDGTCFSIWHGICALPRGQSNFYIPTLWNFVDIGHLVIKQMAKPRFETYVKGEHKDTGLRGQQSTFAQHDDIQIWQCAKTSSLDFQRARWSSSAAWAGACVRRSTALTPPRAPVGRRSWFSALQTKMIWE